MPQESYAYLFIETAMLLAVLAVALATNTWRTLLTKKFLASTLMLYLLWLPLDLLAVKYEVFHFPEHGTLPLRILGLPLEEHLFFPLHTILMWALIILVFSFNEATN